MNKMTWDFSLRKVSGIIFGAKAPVHWGEKILKPTGPQKP